MFCCKHKPCTRVVDGVLILSLVEALTPVVWHLDLSEARVAVFEILSDSEGVHTLVLKKTDGDTVEIASFGTRKGALQALTSAAKALQKADGHLRPVVAVAGALQRSRKRGNGFIIFLLSLIVLMALLWLLFIPGRAAYIKYQIEEGLSQQGNPVAQRHVAPEEPLPEPQGPYGVPQSADEFLKQQGVK